MKIEIILNIEAVNLLLFKKEILSISNPLSDIFEIKFLGFDFSCGAVFIAMVVIAVLACIAKPLGEYLFEKDIPNYIYIIFSVAIILIFCFGW